MSRKIMCVIIVSIMALAVAGCVSAAKPQETVMYEAPIGIDAEGTIADGDERYVPGEPASGAADYSTIERIIIRNASLNLVVPDTDAALDEVDDLVDELDGWIVESNVYQYQEGTRASVTLRIPAEKLDSALERIRSLATEVRSENVSGQDVTEEYVDLQSSLRNREATQARLLEYLEAAEDTESALAVDEQLRQIEAEIEHLKGRIQYLEQSAAMATVSLDIIPDELAQPIQIGGWHPEGTLRGAFQSLIHVLQFLADAAIVIVVLIVPVLLVVAAPIVGLFLLVRVIVRRRRARKTS
ncbi:MAG: DUF4349 domain-containing protein [Chloroflexota bacterium]|nr:DUF4349 domain-containing protein [Chloroflexota bacterium]